MSTWPGTTATLTRLAGYPAHSADNHGQRHPLALTPPRTSDDLRRLGKAISAVHYLTGGNMTHTPGYGALIALGMLNVLKRLNYRRKTLRRRRPTGIPWLKSGRFLTFAGGGPLIGTRLREDENDRGAMKLVSETDEGVVISGKVQMHTSTPLPRTCSSPAGRNCRRAAADTCGLSSP